MTLTFGRAGLDIPIGNPMARTVTGGSVSFTGRLTASTAASAAALREQFLGLASRAELFVPVTFSDDARVAGYYRVASLSVDDHPKSITSGTVGYAYSVDLERATRSTAQLIQTISYAAVRSNDDSVTATQGQFGVQVPYNTTLVAGTGSSPWNTVQLENDIIGSNKALVAYNFTTANPSGPAAIQKWRIEPANYYDGACVIEADIGSTTWRAVTGFVLPSQTLRMSNGFVRVTLAGASMTLAGAKSAATWSTAQTVTFTGDALTLPSSWSYDVVRNDAWGTTVRQVGHTASGYYPIALYASLRRGSRIVEVAVESTSSQSWGVGVNPDVAETTLTAGWAQTTAVDGHKLVFASSPTSANAGGICGITAASDTATWTVGIGVSPSASPWVSPQDLVYSFHGGGGGGTVASVVAG